MKIKNLEMESLRYFIMIQIRRHLEGTYYVKGVLLEEQKTLQKILICFYSIDYYSKKLLYKYSLPTHCLHIGCMDYICYQNVLVCILSTSKTRTEKVPVDAKL